MNQFEFISLYYDQGYLFSFITLNVHRVQPINNHWKLNFVCVSSDQTSTSTANATLFIVNLSVKAKNNDLYLDRSSTLTQTGKNEVINYVKYNNGPIRVVNINVEDVQCFNLILQLTPSTILINLISN